MSKRVLFIFSVLTAVSMVPMRAQSHDEDGKFNFTMGGGLSVPLNPIAKYAGVGGSFMTSGGYNINRHSSVVGQFSWDGLPPSISARTQLNGGSASVNLYSITADYKFRGGFGKTFGYYLISGAGWYYRHTAVSQSTLIPTNTVCQPIWDWYGFSCSDGFVNTVGAATGTSSFGANGGVGFTIRIRETPWKFFVEARYVYAASRIIATQVAPITFGFEFQ